nr:hypothetical protein [Candidatus Sigynarchaeota archaeon]
MRVDITVQGRRVASAWTGPCGEFNATFSLDDTGPGGGPWHPGMYEIGATCTGSASMAPCAGIKAEPFTIIQYIRPIMTARIGNLTFADGTVRFSFVL